MKKIIVLLLFLTLCLMITSFSVSALTKVSTVELEDLDVPLAGAKPDTSVTIRTPGYRVYSLEWYDVTAGRYLKDGEKFTIDHVYRVIIWLEAKGETSVVFRQKRNHYLGIR